MAENTAETPQQQQYPMTNLNVTKDGLVISIMLTPFSAFTQMINEETMNQVMLIVE